MKKVSVGVAIVISALVIGCQESNQFNPISSDSHNSASFVNRTSSNPDGVFELNAQLTAGNTESVDNTYDVTGSIQYTLVPAGNDNYTFSLVTNADLQSLETNGPTGKVYGESIDPVTIVGKDVVTLERVYSVTDLTDKAVDFHITFSLSSDEVQISSMWLSQSSEGGIAKR